MIQALFLEYASSLHMWVTFGLIIAALVLYSMEKVPLELTSLGILTALMLFFHFFPLRDSDGAIMLNPERLLLGFSNPALIAVLALLVLGQAIVRTGSLNEIANIILRICRNHKVLAIALTLFTVAFISQFLNNTPACVIFMPIIAAIAKRLNLSASKVMIPLSYASIVGGITTLVGSSTNLLVSGALVEMGRPALGFFEFAIPGLVIAGVALTYIILVLPRVLPNRAPLASEIVGGENRQFVVQLDVLEDSPMIGKSLKDEKLFEAQGISLKMVHRGEHAFLPPFDDDLKIRPHDILIVSAPRTAISTMVSINTSNMFKKVQEFEARDLDDKASSKSDTVLAEIVIAPASRMIGQNVEQIGFIHNHHCVVLGIQRRSRMITSRMTEIRLAAGDVLLVMGSTEDVLNLREGGDVLVMEWSTEELPSRKYARRVNLIFAGVVGLAAFDIVPIHISALIGVMMVILSGCINLRQSMRALNAQIVFLVAAGLALSSALQVTGGASFLAEHMIELMHGFSPVLVMGAMFLLMAVCTNILSNNATALIFTPIALNTAHILGVDPAMFVFAVIFASNCCSFATPIGYQTNLLVMAPGHYTFSDYMKAGIPLIFIVLATYMTFSYFYFGYNG
jgi:di/tricarboxylate transporter